jgi:peptidyl-prolyl cis-trans isomerase SurA
MLPSLATVAVQAQVKAPRYQGGLDAPAPQLQLPPLPTPITKGGTVVEDVVVRVNDNIISRSDVQRAAQGLIQDAQQNHASPAQIADAEKNMLRDMIDQQLLLSKAKELGLNADAEVIRRLDDIRKENKLPSMEALEQAAKSQGVNFEDFKAGIRNQILTQQVVRDEVGRRLQLTQAEEQKYYDAHKDQFQRPESVKLSEILIPVPENATPAELVQAERKANALKTQIMQGGDFAAIAKKDSGGPTAAQGGELGDFKRGQLAKVLEDQTFSLKPGETTQPIRTRQGYVILRVTEHTPAGPAPLSAVEPQVQEAIYTQQMQPALRTFLTKLREEAYLDIAPGFVDSGASPNETKPVFTTYTAPAVKKKKEKKTVRFERAGRFSTAPASPAAAAPVTASPDTTGTRTLTGPEAAPLIDPKTGLAQIPGVNTRSTKRVKHLHREKVRFGQAPRSTLAEAQSAADAPKVTNASTGPGAPVVLTGSLSGTAAANDPAALAENPLSPSPAPTGKTRFAAKAKEVKAKKATTLTAKKEEKIQAKPEAAPEEEQTAAKVQAAPLGLAGDTTKKPKKPKKVKGAPKQRLEQKPAETKPAPAAIEQTASPALAPDAATPPSTKTPPSAANPANSSVPTSVPNTPGATTLAPANAPPPSSPQQGQPVPGTNPPML